MHGTLRIVFMRLGIAKIDQQAVAEILGDMPVKALDDLSTCGLVGAYYLPQIFRIELAGEDRGVYQVTEHDGELPAFSLRGRWCRWWGQDLGRLGVRGGRR